MITVQERLYAKLNGSTSLRTLLGGADRIYADLQGITPRVGGLTFNEVSTIPGELQGKDVVSIVKLFGLTIVHKQAQEVAALVYKLLDGWTPAATTEAGGMRVEWDWTGPLVFDEDFKSLRQEMRIKIYLAPIAYATPS